MAAAARHLAQEPTPPRRLTPRAVLLRLMLAVGVGFMLYPAFNRLWFTWLSMRASSSYLEAVTAQPDESLTAEWDRACAYNATHTRNVIADPFGGEAALAANAEYASLLDPLGTGVMGCLDIPSIGQRLNIYHGTGERELQQGVGHLAGTSLPVGGTSSHCVLSGHRGLATAKLLTDLDRLGVGDIVYLRVLNQVLAYEVDGAETVLPSQIDTLGIIEGQDLLTLVTCTPYAVNTHRLLVRAHRVPYVPEADQGAAAATFSFVKQAALVLGTLVVAVIVGYVGLNWVAAWRERRTR